MAAKIKWYRYGTKFRHCRPVYKAVSVCWKRHRKLPSVNLSGGRHLGADGLIFGLSEHALGHKMIEHAAEFDVESLDQVQVVTPYDGGVLVRRLPTYSKKMVARTRLPSVGFRS